MRWSDTSTILLGALAAGIAVFMISMISMMYRTATVESPNAPLIGSLVRIADSHNVCGEYMGRREAYVVQSSSGDTYYVRLESQLVNVDSCN